MQHTGIYHLQWPTGESSCIHSFLIIQAFYELSTPFLPRAPINLSPWYTHTHHFYNQEMAGKWTALWRCEQSVICLQRAPLGISVSQEHVFVSQFPQWGLLYLEPRCLVPVTTCQWESVSSCQEVFNILTLLQSRSVITTQSVAVNRKNSLVCEQSCTYIYLTVNDSDLTKNV